MATDSLTWPNVLQFLLTSSSSRSFQSEDQLTTMFFSARSKCFDLLFRENLSAEFQGMGGKKRERHKDKVEYISVIEGILFPIYCRWGSTS